MIDNKEINELCIKVLDRKLTEAIPYIVQLLNHKDMNENKGTPIFVLTELEYPVDIYTLAKIIVNGSSEAKQEALKNLVRFDRALQAEDLKHTTEYLYWYHCTPYIDEIQSSVMQALLYLREFNVCDDGLFRESK